MGKEKIGGVGYVFIGAHGSRPGEVGMEGVAPKEYSRGHDS